MTQFFSLEDMFRRILQYPSSVQGYSEGRSHSMWRASLILSWRQVGAESKMEKQTSEHEGFLHDSKHL